MIRIKKGREPGKLLWYRQQDGASYEQMDKEVREELIDQLLREQGHLCAYCMSKIPESRNLPKRCTCGYDRTLAAKKSR